MFKIAQDVYNHHHKLVLRPEHIWACIQTQFAIYVNKYPEHLRSKFVSHEGKEELTVITGNAELPGMGGMAFELVKLMKGFLNDERLVEWMLPAFSTTTDQDKMVFSAIAMGTMQNYFSYKILSMCGLPEVTLLGTIDDWKLIKSRVNKLLEYDFDFEVEEKKKFIAGLFSRSKTEKKIKNNFFMKRWRDMLIPVLDKLIETAEGKPDYYWWNQICHYEGGGSGPAYICGWICTFNVFDEHGEWMGDNFSYEFETRKESWPVIDTNHLAPTYASCPVTIDQNGIIFQTQIYAGIMCADVVEESTVVPRMDWVMYKMKENV
jgi:hypothetical protein